MISFSITKTYLRGTKSVKLISISWSQSKHCRRTFHVQYSLAVRTLRDTFRFPRDIWIMLCWNTTQMGLSVENYPRVPKYTRFPDKWCDLWQIGRVFSYSHLATSPVHRLRNSIDTARTGITYCTATTAWKQKDGQGWCNYEYYKTNCAALITVGNIM